ncbi:MAG: sugar phosphate isomerase/epimerase [Nanoarchaeota archaeon]|nr:sugar phosphate isomerase/epimerase [Nanoarchaeota archaeon]
MQVKLKNRIATSNHILSLYPIHEAADILGKTGYDAMEIWAEELELQVRQRTTSVAKIKAVLKKRGMAGAMHAPLRELIAKEPYKYNICSKDATLREMSIKRTLDALDFAKALGFGIVVMHPGHTDSPDDKVDMQYWELQVDAFQKIARHAENLGVKVGLETMEHRPKEFITESKHVDKILKAVNSPNLGVTFDLIHAYTHGVDRPIELLDSHHPNIFHVHISGHSKDKTHVPFSMTIIHHFYLDKVLERLVKNYSGMISIEGHTKGIVEQTKYHQKQVVKENLEYLHREMKSLHRE